ncbi:MAG: glycerate kinase, partial [Candidatus Neomarinimicrobiota bacterium]
KIVLAPDSFKGSMTAPDVCNAMTEGILKIFPDAEIISIPLADGGEGTVDSLVSATDGKFKTCKVLNPIGKEITAKYGILGDKKTAVIEMAAASGLPLIPREKQNPLYTSTYGTGQLILNALNSGCTNFVIGIGGSATTDGGAGVAQALGVKFFDKTGKKINEPMNGKLIGKCESFSMGNIHPAVKNSRFIVACDVDNPLLGPKGAVYVYSTQKGATDEILPILETNMKHFYNIVEHILNISVIEYPGAGAAGGLGAGLIAFLGANLKSGVDIILDAVEFEKQTKNVDLIFTGEGKIDSQTAYGKTIAGVLKIAQKNNIPVIAIAGKIGNNIGELYQHGLKAIFSICNGPITFEESMKNSYELTTKITEQICRIFT